MFREGLNAGRSLIFNIPEREKNVIVKDLWY
jgi:hypothetical protein